MEGAALKPYKRTAFAAASAIVYLTSTAAALILASAPPSSQAAQSVGFGTVNFPVSCKAQVQPAFDTGVAELHNFQYEQSLSTFAEVAKQDPQCAMAYWGQAMSLYHQLWDWPNAQTLKKGSEFMARAKEIGTKSAWEREYITAAATYYQDRPGLSDEARAEAYSHAMGELHARFPDDVNGAAFYALSLIAQRTRDHALEMAHRKQAIAILQKLFIANPNNPGVAHYLIHSSDTPALARLGLNAARRYAQIAPSSAHALHMPSHIFTDLGLWEESVKSNIASMAAARHATLSGEYNASGHQFHAMTFLEYAYLESGQDAAAWRLIGEVQQVPGAKPTEIAGLQADFKAEYATEIHDWKQAARLGFAPGLYTEEKEQIDLARTIGAARSGDVAGARNDLQELIHAETAMSSGGHGYPAKAQPKSMDQHMGEAWVDYAAGRSAEALASMQEAARMEDDDAWKEGQGAVQIPAREMLGDLLMELHQPAKALTEYEAVLKQSPNRFDSLYGAASAAQAAGEAAVAQQYYAALVKSCGAHADRPELQNVRQFLAEKQ
jgi:tetratricopeptide (TPR) repeat protein